MSGGPPQKDLADLNERLLSGIETCRSVIANYRALLSDEQLAAGVPVAADLAGAEQPNGCDEERDGSVGGAAPPGTDQVVRRHGPI